MIEKEKITKQTEYEIIKSVTCDICKRVNEYRNENWAGRYEVNRAKVSLDVGTNYPDDYDVESTEFDVCPDCFANKLVPWMATFGAQPRKTDE